MIHGSLQIQILYKLIQDKNKRIEQNDIPTYN